uniref:ANK_REP_REGION domain-containing protein n=1 Tax=Macrostomum lignano TaxID=282301 RepID=A0A1I8JS99_9PLAT
MTAQCQLSASIVDQPQQEYRFPVVTEKARSILYSRQPYNRSKYVTACLSTDAASAPYLQGSISVTVVHRQLGGSHPSLLHGGSGCENGIFRGRYEMPSLTFEDGRSGCWSKLSDIAIFCVKRNHEALRQAIANRLPNWREFTQTAHDVYTRHISLLESVHLAFVFHTSQLATAFESFTEAIYTQGGANYTEVANDARLSADGANSAKKLGCILKAWRVSSGNYNMWLASPHQEEPIADVQHKAVRANLLELQLQLPPAVALAEAERIQCELRFADTSGNNELAADVFFNRLACPQCSSGLLDGAFGAAVSQLPPQHPEREEESPIPDDLDLPDLDMMEISKFMEEISEINDLPPVQQRHSSFRGDFAQMRRLATRQLVTFNTDAAHRTVLMLVADAPETPIQAENRLTARGDTAAHLAARRDHLRLLTLLSFDAKWLQNRRGATPLMEAARTGSWRCAKHLLHLLRQKQFNECEKYGNSERERLLGLKDVDGRTALNLARLGDHSELASDIEREMRLVVTNEGYISGLTDQCEAPSAAGVAPSVRLVLAPLVLAPLVLAPLAGRLWCWRLCAGASGAGASGAGASVLAPLGAGASGLAGALVLAPLCAGPLLLAASGAGALLVLAPLVLARLWCWPPLVLAPLVLAPLVLCWRLWCWRLWVLASGAALWCWRLWCWRLWCLAPLCWRASGAGASGALCWAPLGAGASGAGPLVLAPLLALVLAPLVLAPLEKANRKQLKLATSGNSAGLRQLGTQEGYDLPDKYGRTALMWAAGNSNCSDEYLWEQLLQLADPTCADMWSRAACITLPGAATLSQPPPCCTLELPSMPRMSNQSRR